MKRPALLVMTALFIGSIYLSACAPVSTPTPPILPTIATIQPILPAVSETPSGPQPTPNKYFIPVYYPASYLSIVEASKAETGLVIYSIMAEENWKPIIEAFNNHYPWIKVTTSDLNAAEVFNRYYDETQKNIPTADMVVSSDPISWLNFFAKNGVLPYHSQEDLLIPDWSKSAHGTYTVSSDPMVIIYNKKLVAKPPKSIADLIALVKTDPQGYKNQIVTYDAELNATGFAINWFWADKLGADAWTDLNALGETQPVLMTSAGNMVDAVGKGNAKIGYFVSAIAIYPKLPTYPDLGWSYIDDGQPILLRNMAITQKAASPNSAKLMLDFILSQEGQYALALGGLTPYRSDVSGVSTYHLDKISTEVGQNDLILFSFDTRLMGDNVRQNFIDKWKVAIHKPASPTPTPTP